MSKSNLSSWYNFEGPISSLTLLIKNLKLEIVSSFSKGLGMRTISAGLNPLRSFAHL